MLTVITKEQIDNLNDVTKLKINKSIYKQLIKIEQYPTNYDLILVSTELNKVEYIVAINLTDFLVSGYVILYNDAGRESVNVINNIIPNIIFIDNKLYQFNYYRSNVSANISSINLDDKKFKTPKFEYIIDGVFMYMCDINNTCVLDAYIINNVNDLHPIIVIKPEDLKSKRKKLLIEAMNNYIYDNISKIYSCLLK